MSSDRKANCIGGWLVFVLLVSSCGGSQPQPEEPSHASPAASQPATSQEEKQSTYQGSDQAGPQKWADMNVDQKLQFMKKTVMPKMKALFVAHDAEEFAEINCITCHGQGAKEGKFEMPNPDMHKLSEGFAEEKKKHPKTLQFMMDTVVPEMATLLDTPAYDPKTRQGFGCFQCHTAK